jgi:hypothetical protein
MLQYNKLYQSLKKVSAEWHAGHVQWDYSWYYIKFFNDGRFIYGLFVSDDLEKINNGFDENSVNDNCSGGTFRIDNDYLITLNFENNIEIRGAVISNEKIILNGKLSWELYTVA